MILFYKDKLKKQLKRGKTLPLPNLNLQADQKKMAEGFPPPFSLD